MMSDLRIFHNLALEKNFFHEVVCDQPKKYITGYQSEQSSSRPNIYLSAGIHGDEPAGFYALVELMREDFFNGSANWTIFPLLNPTGWMLKTRENEDKVDLNRDYLHGKTEEVSGHLAWFKRHEPQYDMSLCLHEDWETEGFYLYDGNLKNGDTLSEDIIRAVRAVCPIQETEEIEGHKAEGGIIRPLKKDIDAMELWPEAIYLLKKHTKMNFTLETPSSLGMEIRVAAQKAAIKTAVESLVG